MAAADHQLSRQASASPFRVTLLQDLTGCIPTFDRAQLLRQTLVDLARCHVCPSLVLVSEGSSDPSSREATASLIHELGPQLPFEVRLLSTPPEGNRSGNRNWLVRHVTTPFVLFLDDDISLDPRFLADAHSRLADDEDLVAVTTGTTSGRGDVWLTKRGHFRQAMPGEPVSPSFMNSVWRADVLALHGLDERIRYGYEDADLAFRLHRAGVLKVEVSPYESVDRGLDQTVGLSPRARSQEADAARMFVGLRRYWTSRRKLLQLLACEVAINCLRRRRILPRAQVPGQWRRLARHLLLGRRAEL